MHFFAIVSFVFISWGIITCTHAAGVATLSLAPSSAAGLTARSLPTSVPAGSITGVPDDGLDIYFSDSSYNSITNALKNSCSTPNSATCQNALQSAISSSSLQANQLQPRQTSLIVAGLVGLISIIIGSNYNANQLPPKVIHITPQELGAASSIATATAVVAVPPSGAASTWPISSSPTATSTPTVSIAPQASGGDLHILLSADQAKSFQSIMGLPGVCNTGNKKKRQSAGSSTGCIYQDAVALLYNAFRGPSAALPFVNAPAPMPGFADSAIQQALTQFIGDAEAAAPAFGVTTDRMDQIATTLFDLAYIWNEQDVALGQDNIISGYLLSSNTLPKCPQVQQSGSSTNLVCSLASCKGDFNEKICTVDPWKGCRCLNFSPLRYDDYYDQAMLGLQPDALTQLLAGASTASSPITCFSASSPNTPAYVTSDTAYNQINTFCDGVGSGASSPINVNRTFWQQTPDYFAFVVKGTFSGSFDVAGCKTTLSSLLTNCDGVPSNPMNWKFGGTFVTGGLTYTAQPLFYNRVWPPPKAPFQSCTGTYHGLYDGFSILGAGWSSWDYGQKTLYPSITACVGSRPSGWTFKYFLYDGTPDQHFGGEWLATFNTPIWTRARCFDNNKVQGNSGGPGKGGGGCGGDG